MYSSIFTEHEWKAPVQKVYRSQGCASCGLSRYYTRNEGPLKTEGFRAFQFTSSTEETPAPTITETPSAVFKPNIEKLLEVVASLRRLPVKQLMAVMEPVLPQDVVQKYRSMFPRSLQRLLESYTDRQIVDGILYLPQENIEMITAMQVPAPLMLPKKSEEKQMSVMIDQSFYSSTLFTEYKEIPKDDPAFSYMDPTFAIGNTNSSYTPFNVIVNLDYPYNGVEYHHLTTEYTSDKKVVIRVGINDSSDEPMREVLDHIVPLLMTIVKYHGNKPRILFHCRAGISRSASVALAYYGKQMKYDITRAYSQLATRRPVIRPNPGFIEALEEYLI
jgi:protein-tyrosine phosphatase